MVDTVAAIWVLRRDGTALLQHRDDKPGLQDPGIWAPPSGHADPGESMLDCARRELKEETEYAALDLRFLKSFDLLNNDGEPFRVTFFWTWYDEVQSIVCHEGQELAFINRSAAPNYQIPAFLLDVWDASVAAADATAEALQP